MAKFKKKLQKKIFLQFLAAFLLNKAPKKSHFCKLPNIFFALNYILGGCIVPIGIKILAVGTIKWQRFFEAVFRGLSVIIEWFLRYFNHTT